MDVKKGSGALTRTQRLIRQAVEKKSIAWKTMRIPDD
jgi:predicted Holliday junction resolvase-like endonuclease